MKQFGAILVILFLLLVGFYFFVLKPEKFETTDMLDDILQRGYLRVGVNMNSKPFAYKDENGELVGYDIDLARNIAQYIVHNSKYVQFVPVTPSDRMMKVSTGEVDIVIATMTITPQREQIINFTIPYDIAGQALLVKSSSKLTSIQELAGQNVGVVWGTTAEKNMMNLVPNANIVGFKTYDEAYEGLKKDKIVAITSDDTILSRYAIDDSDVKLLPKRYSKEPYGIAFKKGKGTERLKQALNEAVTDLKQKNVINRIHKKWLGYRGKGVKG